ncbi:PilN domain-containing protein [Citrobacter enshiensis]|uniref:PilN domain-containing protein n=1 Tax=Citrobacter enshiensis TaxID=2971264 RepID=UPI0023E80452|nr:PilN domain-containing protein [Citrobacter enshiensis]WET40962.1 PilN domain-containing protein [Citrobacter enshiensis]
MSPPINFMPWRRSRRMACLRCWAVLFGGSLLLFIAIALSVCSVTGLEAQTDTILLEAERTRAAALMARKQGLEQQHQQRQQVLQRHMQRAQTRHWQSVLDAISRQMPEQAWFTRMAYQQDTLELEGNALTFSALRSLEAMLRDLPMFELSNTGSTRQDAQGRWQFHYQLKKSVMHERPL